MVTANVLSAGAPISRAHVDGRLIIRTLCFSNLFLFNFMIAKFQYPALVYQEIIFNESSFKTLLRILNQAHSSEHPIRLSDDDESPA